MLGKPPRMAQHHRHRQHRRRHAPAAIGKTQRNLKQMMPDHLKRISLVDCSSPQSGVGHFCSSLFSEPSLAAQLLHVRLDRKNHQVVERNGYDCGTANVLGSFRASLPASLWNPVAGRCLATQKQLHLSTQNLSRLARPDCLLTVHDLFYRTCPRNATDPWLAHWLYTGMSRAGHIAVDSQATADDVSALLGHRCPPIDVIYLFVDVPEMSPCPKGDYFLHVSSEEPRKNFDTVLRAFAILKSRPGNRDLRLIKVGKAASLNARKRHEALATELGIRASIEFRQGIDNAELAKLYAGALATFFPSSAEGFGYPLLESLAQGTEVIAGDIPVLKELGSDHVTYVDPKDPGAMADAAAAYLQGTDTARRECLQNQARNFSRQRFIAGTTRLYQRLWGI